MATDSLEPIRAGFSDYFSDFDLALPATVERRGELSGAGWSVTWVLGEDEAGATCLDFLAEHRMTNMRHVRITASGEVLTLDTFMEGVVFDPDVDADKEAASLRYAEHNRRVGELLREKGLLR